jgi:hypothetical protein
MKNRLRSALVLLLSILALTVSVLADFGPKPQLTVTVANAPTEPYYLDLLAEGDKNRPAYGGANLDDNYGDYERVLDSDLLDAIVTATPEGWHSCMVCGTDIPMWGDLYAECADTQGNPMHVFGYMGLPDTYRIVIVTSSGESWVSQPLRRIVLQSSVTVDWAAKTAGAPPIWVAYIVEFLATCIPTLLIEGLVLLLFGYHLKKSWKPFLLVNLATQTGLYLSIGLIIIQRGFNFFYIFYFVPAELVILAVEIALYRRYLTERSRQNATAYAIVANLFSAVLGLFLASPVWEWVSSLT